MNSGSIKSVKHDILFPLRRGEHDFSYFAYLRAFLPTRKPTTNIRVESLHAELHLPRFSVLLWPIGEDCLLLAQCSRGTLFPAELAEIILHPLVFEGQSRKCIAQVPTTRGGSVYFGFIDRWNCFGEWIYCYRTYYYLMISTRRKYWMEKVGRYGICITRVSWFLRFL